VPRRLGLPGGLGRRGRKRGRRRGRRRGAADEESHTESQFESHAAAGFLKVSYEKSDVVSVSLADSTTCGAADSRPDEQSLAEPHTAARRRHEIAYQVAYAWPYFQSDAATRVDEVADSAAGGCHQGAYAQSDSVADGETGGRHQISYA